MKDNMTYRDFLQKEHKDFIELLELHNDLFGVGGMSSFRPFEDKEDDLKADYRGGNADYPLGFNLILRIPKEYLRGKFHECKDEKSDLNALNSIEKIAKEYFPGEYTSEDKIDTAIYEETSDYGNKFYEISLRVEYSNIDQLLADHPKVR